MRLSRRPSGTSPLIDALGEALDDGGLADAGLTDQYRVVLGAALQHLDRATDFVVATDDRVQLAVAGAFREINRVLLQRLARFLRISAGHTLTAAHVR
jgi:hypothetical protein